MKLNFKNCTTRLSKSKISGGARIVMAFLIVEAMKIQQSSVQFTKVSKSCLKTLNVGGNIYASHRPTFKHINISLYKLMVPELFYILLNLIPSLNIILMLFYNNYSKSVLNIF